MTRLQGGTSGILAALETGRLDPLCAELPEERDLTPYNAADRRALVRRQRCRDRAIARRTPF